MRVIYTTLITAACLLGLATSATAQKKTVNYVPPALEELPCRPVDTIPTVDSETSIIIFSNNTWEYYRPTLADKYGDLAVFNDYWDTENLFAYRRIELDDLSATTEIKLISSLSDFHPPIVGRVFSKYGPRGRRSHNGVDIPLKIGEPIYATFDGRVRVSTYNTGGYGNMVIIRHLNGLETWYAHLSKNNVKSGEYVKAGQIIGFGGSTGRSRGPHLHFETRYCDQTFDPEHLFDFASGQIKYQTFVLEKSYFNIRSRASDELEEHDFDDLAYMNAGGVDLTSEEILKKIAESQTGGKKQATVTSSDGSAVYHTVVSGDMLGKLSIKYGVSIDQICRLNNITRTTTLKLGRKLRIR